MVKAPFFGKKQHTCFFSLYTVAAVIIFVLLAALIEYAVLYRSIRSKKNAYQNAVMQAGDRLNFTMREMQRLSHMLMINADVQGFVTQGTVEQGSPDIQKIIDAQRQLSYVKPVHPVIEDIFVYSKTSDYLLEADNAFFDIDAMYSSLFEFKDLNSGQWRSEYLRPVYMNKWMAETSITTNGVSRNVLIFSQTFPLQNSSANTGKLMMLLKSSHFDSVIEPLFIYPKTQVFIADSQKQVLFMRTPKDASYAQSVMESDFFDRTETDSFASFTHKINGKKYLAFVRPLKASNTFCIVLVPLADMLKAVEVRRFVLPPLILVLLFVCAFYFVKRPAGRLRFMPQREGSFLQHGEESFKPVQDTEPEACTVQEADSKTVGRILSYIEDNYANPLLNLSQMAEDFSIKENFLYYFFRSRIHKSFAQYLEDFRLEKAKSIIEADIKEPVHTLAEKCGYANSQTFRRAFKKKYGLTPSEFKQRVFAESGEL
ncbi:AraC family transcriptional regulator [Treponema sp. HNW]|uniref:AraC family transcriptional regulator n=1 Tax=Treponema sp. HNW TaxID=3116654 RepID=UPI003D0EBCE1